LKLEMVSKEGMAWHCFISKYVIRKVTVDRNTTLWNKLIPVVGHAVDICIMGRMKEAMKQTYEEWKRAAKEVGLSFNVNKTKEMVHSRCTIHIGNKIKIGGDIIEVVDEFICLGICITKLKDIRRRIGLASNTYPSLPQ
jgi:hypothetical protein